MPKHPQKAPVQYNHRPTTCLGTTWKQLSDIIAAKMNRHIAQYMSGAQNGTGRNIRGVKQQLLVDGAVTQDCKTRLNNLCTSWTHYKKAYDSMPYTWIPECLKIYKINKTLRTFIKKWQTTQ